MRLLIGSVAYTQVVYSLGLVVFSGFRLAGLFLVWFRLNA